MTYDELVAASQSYADRQDIEVSDSMDIFIQMSEARMNRILKTRKQSTRVFTPTIAGLEYYGLPADYAGMRDIQLNTTSDENTSKSVQFHYLSPEQMNNKDDQPFGGKNYYTVIANQLQIYPKQEAGATLEIVYFQKVPNLSPAEPSNWMSEDHPDIYLSSMVAEIELFAKNYDVSKVWADRTSNALGELVETDVVERWSGAALQMRTA